MHRSKPALLVMLATSVGALPGAAAAQGRSASFVVGKVYEGVLSSRIIPPKGSSSRARSHNGRATAVLEDLGKGKARLVLDGRLLKDGDASFTADGAIAGGRWSGQSKQFSLSIRPDGTVSGRGIFEGRPTTLEGSYRNNDLHLVVELTVPKQTPGGYPAGTRFQFGYDLRYFPPSKAANPGGRTPPGGCRDVRWRTKLTPNLFGGGMNSVRVPECIR